MKFTISGSKLFHEHGPERTTIGTTDGARVREVILGCGCVKLYRVLPKVGDYVYCGRRHGFVKVPDRRTGKRRQAESDSADADD